MKSLLQDDDIIIRPADKGSGIVVMDTQKYIEGLEEEMFKSESYEKTEAPKYQETEKLVKKTVNKMYKNGHIDDELKKYLVPKFAKPGRLKGNPKLHKKKRPLRTIVNGIGTPTKKMAEVAEYQLNEYVEQSPSYIKDTTDFLTKLNEINVKLPKGAILFCFDVEKLYPSIPREEGLQACEEALNQRSNQAFSSEAVMDMIRAVLDNNVFHFNSREYIQKDGVAIGSRLGRNYACAYMRKWDEALGKFEKQPMVYYRYIDDGFGIWLHGEDSLKQFCDFANNIHQNINVELRYSKEKIEFLDTMVILDNGSIETDLFTKPSDKHIYVHKNSNHPASVKKSLPYGLGIRIRRICSRESDYMSRRTELKSYLRKRGYSSRFIESQLEKVDKINRSDLLSYKTKDKNKDRVPLVITYSKHLPDIHKISRDHLPLLHKSSEMQQIFDKPPLVAFKRDRNLTDILVHGKHNKIFKSKDGRVNRCPTDNCAICAITKYDKEIPEIKNIRQDANCQTTNAIYGIHCEVCNKIVYVGETERTIAERIKEHLADVRHKREKAVSFHFNSKDHDIADLNLIIIEKCKENSKFYRKAREVHWIETLNTVAPIGLNKKTQLGILWPDYQIERDTTHAFRGMVSMTS